MTPLEPTPIVVSEAVAHPPRAGFLAALRAFVLSLNPARIPQTVFLVCGFFILLAISREFGPSHYFKEGRPLTLLSGAILFSAGLANLAILYLRSIRIDGVAAMLRSRKAIWLLMGMGFVYLGLDEVACYHEKIGDYIGQIPHPPTALAERADGLFLALAAPIGLSALWAYRAEIVQFRGYWRFFAAGSSLFGLMVVSDFLTDESTWIASVTSNEAMELFIFQAITLVEDLAKLLGVSCFLGLFLSILQNQWKSLSARQPKMAEA